MRAMIIENLRLKTYGQILFQNLGDWVVPFEEQVCHPKCEIYNNHYGLDLHTFNSLIKEEIMRNALKLQLRILHSKYLKSKHKRGGGYVDQTF